MVFVAKQQTSPLEGVRGVASGESSFSAPSKALLFKGGFGWIVYIDAENPLKKRQKKTALKGCLSFLERKTRLELAPNHKYLVHFQYVVATACFKQIKGYDINHKYTNNHIILQKQFKNIL